MVLPASDHQRPAGDQGRGRGRARPMAARQPIQPRRWRGLNAEPATACRPGSPAPLNKISDRWRRPSTPTQRPAPGAFEPVLRDRRRHGLGRRRRSTVGRARRRAAPACASTVERRPASAPRSHTGRSADRRATTLLVVRHAGEHDPARSMQLYLLFPLTAEQAHAERRAAHAAGRRRRCCVLLLGRDRLPGHPAGGAAGADGRRGPPSGSSAGLLDERMQVTARTTWRALAESFNQMAAELQRQIQQLEEMSAGCSAGSPPTSRTSCARR